MSILINPNLAYILVVVGITLFLLSYVYTQSKALKYGMVVCLLAAGVEIFYLRVNLWAFLVVALCPLPFILAMRRGRVNNPLFLIPIIILPIAATFVFLDQESQPLQVNSLAGMTGILCAAVIWISSTSLRNVKGARLSDDPDSVIGLIGEVKTDIEPHSVGSVLVEGEIWQARSKEPVSAGRLVRVMRQDGFWLTVKEVEKPGKH